MKTNFLISIRQWGAERLPQRGSRTLILLTMAVLLTGIIAFASIPDADGVVHGCYKRSGGTIRVIDSAAEQCGANETPLTWNQIGQQGPQGPAGPQGEQGPAGTVATSDVFFASFATDISMGEQGVLLGWRNERTTVLTLEIPAGAYMVEARLDFSFESNVGGSSYTYCSLPRDAGTTVVLDSSDRPGVLQSSSNAQREITTVINHAGGALTLACRAFSTSQIGTTVQNATLLATPVGTVH